MTKTRIRYKEANPGVYLSTTFFPTTQGNVKVSIDTNKGAYTLLDVTSGNVLMHGSASSLHTLKKAAKQALVKVGVVFETEKRVRLEKIKEELKTLGVEVN